MLLDPTQQDTAVGYAIGRAVGSAVVRNLLRRRLRVLFAQRADRLPPGAMLVGVNRSVAAQVGAWSFAQLETEVDELCRRLSTAAVAS
jgi:ribonuclease P protein component